MERKARNGWRIFEKAKVVFRAGGKQNPGSANGMLNKENMCETGALGKVGEKDECFTYTATEMLSSGVNFKCAVSLKIF